jgi:HEPN domain-containing protein
MERSDDWLDQAEGDLEHAKNDLKYGFYDWAVSHHSKRQRKQ